MYVFEEHHQCPLISTCKDSYLGSMDWDMEAPDIAPPAPQQYRKQEESTAV